MLGRLWQCICGGGGGSAGYGGHGGGYGGYGGYGAGGQFGEIAESGPPWRVQLHEFVEARSLSGRVFEGTTFAFILLSIVLAILETVAVITESAAWGNGLSFSFQVYMCDYGPFN